MMLYLTAVLAVGVLAVWLRAGRPGVGRSVVLASVAGAALVCASLVVVAPAYLRVKHDHPEAKRTLADLQTYSPPWRSFVTSSEFNPVWGSLTRSEREKLPAVGEQTLFPGATIALLAIVGLLFGGLSLRVRIGLLIAGLIAFLFSLGLTLDGGRLTYKLLYEHAPGWDGVRTPGRFQTLTTLVLALLAGAGVHALFARLGRRWGAVLIAVASIGVLAEGTALGSGSQPGLRAPHSTPLAYPAGLERVKAPYVIIPTQGLDPFFYMLWSTRGFPKIVNGVSGFEPELSRQIREIANGFPVKADQLRPYGVRSVVILRNEPLAKSRAPRGWRRYETRGLVVFEDMSPSRR